ncbi:PREDICTED: dorsal-ventral patterning protein tolloid-like [Acropora digitifera]|uniref:dorsal-ventral patterning protein tolloid-like n=1 Tax=Acropora digitifera TaxID=70779 RepID=UPI00077A1CD9|nr:PREDICTED: dorsal-ventral patterning protein tolloid-like [Acropora digitifera]
MKAFILPYDYLRITDDRRNTIGTYCGVKTGQRIRVVATVAVLTFRSDYIVQDRGFELIFSFSPRGFTYFQSCSSGQTDCHARLSSPLISSGAKWKCLEFWYYTAYPGQLKVLSVPEKTNSHTLKTYNYNSYGWRLERVALSANFTYRVVFEGSLRGFYDADFLVAVDNVLFLTDECRERPSRYNCSRNSSEKDASRYIFSPIYYFYYHYYDYYYYYYHSYEYYYYYYYYYYRYVYYKRCNWTISAPYGNIIKLRFIDFQLEERPSCSGDYIEVYDGYFGEFKLLGRYCGQRYPSFLKSSSNVLKILFSDKSLMSVFKLYFSSEKLDAGRRNCIQLKDCPSSCVCFPVSSKSQDMVVTVEEGKEVIYVPKTFPTNTTVIFFQGNKIWYIEKTSFSGLLKLEYL